MSRIEVEGHEVVDLRGRLPVRKGAGGYPARPLEGVEMAVIHYSGVEGDCSALQIAEYQTAKTSGDPFPEIAYSFVVRRGGTIEQCHDLEVRSWHAGGSNNDTGIGICLPGDSWPTQEQIEATSALIQALNLELGRGGVLPALRVAGHKELSPTLCPGPYWDKWKWALMGKGKASRRNGDATSLPAHSPNGDGNGRTLPVPVVLGFRRVYQYVGAERCGVPLSSEAYDGNGDSTQRFSRCEMRWDKSQNRVWITFDA